MLFKEVVKAIKLFTEPLKRSIQLSIGRCILLAVNDSSKMQTVKVSLLKDEIKEVERFQQYGFTSVPLPGAEGVCVFVGGNREHGICIAMDDRLFRLKGLTPGQVALYDQSGNKLILKNNGAVVLESLNVEIGKVGLEKALKGETFQSWFNNHTHIDSLGNQTAVPTQQSLPIHLSQEVKLGSGV